MIARIKALLRRIPARARAQVARFARVFVFAAIPAVIAGWHVHHVQLAVLGAAITAGGEAVWRQLRLPPEAKQLLGALADLERHRSNVPKAAPAPTVVPTVAAPKSRVVKGGVLGAGNVPSAPPPPKPVAKKTASVPVKKAATKKT